MLYTVHGVCLRVFVEHMCIGFCVHCVCCVYYKCCVAGWLVVFVLKSVCESVQCVQCVKWLCTSVSVCDMRVCCMRVCVWQREVCTLKWEYVCASLPTSTLLILSLLDFKTYRNFVVLKLLIFLLVP